MWRKAQVKCYVPKSRYANLRWTHSASGFQMFSRLIEIGVGMMLTQGIPRAITTWSKRITLYIIDSEPEWMDGKMVQPVRFSHGRFYARNCHKPREINNKPAAYSSSLLVSFHERIAKQVCPIPAVRLVKGKVIWLLPHLYNSVLLLFVSPCRLKIGRSRRKPDSGGYGGCG